jgi:MFS family permease
MMPISQSVLTDSIPSSRRGAAFGMLGFWSSMGQVALILTPGPIPFVTEQLWAGNRRHYLDPHLCSGPSRSSTARHFHGRAGHLLAMAHSFTTSCAQRRLRRQVFHFGAFGGDIYGWRLGFLMVGITSVILGVVIQETLPIPALAPATAALIFALIVLL